MHEHKLLKEARAKIHESIESIRNINGESYAKTVTVLLMGMHLTRMVATYCQHLHPHQAESMRDQLLGTMAFAADCIIDGYGFSDDTEKEMMDWAEKLCGHIDNAYERIAKERQ